MAIPDYQSVMLPLLKLAGDGQEHAMRSAIDLLGRQFKLSDDELTQLLPSGASSVFASRVGWARTYLKQSGLLVSPRRGVFKITSDGLSLLLEQPAEISLKTLERYPSFQAFKARSRESQTGTQQFAATVDQQRVTPEDALAVAYQTLRDNLESELLEQVKISTPAFFERLVIDLLVAMGYGGSRQDAGRAIGRSGDGGIDGIIKEDRLGLDVIYVQAKKWEGSVGRPEIQKFAGALQGQRASKGVVITTSSFTREATEFANMIASKIILIDGALLAQLMVDHNVAVASMGVYEVKKIDQDYFESN
ncbi:restriction endonuclease [Casimicrobium huifangae]|jgi:restriction system protein|uniref:restriction endonuclease n=1 Tax=Casimicrobium huifangae TaxID=2591109 RepID=UPI0012ECA866|nr:restriction endonuclease [Casimicrobium huifangae]HOB03344.1 restriction endonuclease [Casimicrobium huifangae]